MAPASIVIWVLILGLVLVAAPFFIEWSRKPVTDLMRANAPGQFAKLSQGQTHYRWDGPTDGPICVCVHGLTTPSFVWRGLVLHLNDMGIRTLSYDLYGRGFSDAASGPQSAEFFIQQLTDMLEHQNIKHPFTVVGYSMGGAISAGFAHNQPQRVNRLILIAPAGMVPVGNAFTRFCAQTPLLGTWLMHMVYPVLLRRGLRAEADLPSSVPGITKLQALELKRRGFLPAVLSSLRNTLTSPMASEHQGIGETDIPVLAIWGKDDAVIPLSAKDVLSEWNSKAVHAVVAGAGHGVTYTHTEEVAQAMRDYISDAP